MSIDKKQKEQYRPEVNTIIITDVQRKTDEVVEACSVRCIGKI